MKKFAFVFILAILCMGMAFAWQDSYRQSSDEVQTFYQLRRLSGTSTAEPTFPISADQLLALVGKLDTSGFGETAMALYDDLVQTLESPQAINSLGSLGFDMSAKIEAFGIHSDDEADELYYPYWNRPDAVALEFKFDATQYFTGFVTINLAPTYLYSREFGNNIEGFYTMVKACGYGENANTRINGLNVNIPDRAYGSFGDGYFNITAGRDRVSEGDGFTGNLTIGDNFIYDDYIKASFVSGPFSYDLTLITYDDAVDYEYRFKNERKNVVNHRFSVAFCKYLSVSITEGAMIYTDNLFSDPRVFNPFMMLHDTFTFLAGDTNNYFSAEAVASLPLGFEVDFQYLFDQIQAGFEDDSTGSTASALLANVSWTHEVGPGILTAYAEFANVAAGCYLKENEPRNPDDWTGEYEKLDLIMEVSNTWYYCYNQSALGYTYGPDVMVLGAGASYSWRDFDFSFDALYVRKGLHGFGTNEQRASDLVAGGEGLADTSMLRLSLEGSGWAHGGLVGIDVGFGLNVTTNKDHLESNGTTVSPLFKFAISVDPSALLKRHSL